jgi:hypothetical protein
VYVQVVKVGGGGGGEEAIAGPAPVRLVCWNIEFLWKQIHYNDPKNRDGIIYRNNIAYTQLEERKWPDGSNLPIPPKEVELINNLFYISEDYDKLFKTIIKRDKFYDMYTMMQKLKQDPKTGSLRIATGNNQKEMINIKNQGLLGGSKRKCKM